MSEGEGRAARLAAGIARALLVFYPPSFRRDMGPHVVSAFSERAVDRTMSGGPLRFAVWLIRGVASLVVNVPGAWLDVARTRRRAGGTQRASSAALRPAGVGAGFAADLRDAQRALRGAPVVTAAAVLSLALGIGANTAIFSIADSLLLRPLPVRHAERLALLSDGDSPYDIWWTNPIWEAVRDRAGLFDGAFAWGETSFDASSGGTVDPVAGLRASGRMFEVLGVGTVLGRAFTEADDRRGAEPVTVISHGFWQRRYGGSRDVIGRTLILDRTPFTIIGVSEAGFFGPAVGRTFDVAVPIASLSALGRDAQLDSRSSWWLNVMVRLASGQSPERATAMLRAVQSPIAEETRPLDVPESVAAEHLEAPFRLQPAAGGTSGLRVEYARPLAVVMAIVALTLLIACGNITNLQLARATARRHDLAVRTALGASRWRLVRQLLTESLLLSALGGVLGIAVAYRGGRLIVNQLSTAASPVFLDLRIDARLLAFTGAVAIGTALLGGVVPALRAARATPIDAMKAHGRGAAPGRSVELMGFLVVAQVALSLVLLVAGGLLVRTFAVQASRDPGFDRDRALLVRIATQHTGLDAEGRRALYDDLRAAAAGLPGVSAAALSVTTPLGDNTMNRFIDVPGSPVLPEDERRAYLNIVGPEWFAAMGTAVLEGRPLDARDRSGGERAAIVNLAFARRHFAGTSAIGRTIAERPGPGVDPAPLRIVGVVEDAVYRSLRDPPPPTMYWALPQTRPPSTITLVVRASVGPPEALVPELERALTARNANLSLTFRSMADQVNAAIQQERLLARLSGFFALLGLLLAALGLYGVTSCVVHQRHTEIGIRLALGFAPSGVVRWLLVRVGLLGGAGLAIGGLVSLWSTRLMGTLLYGLTPRDPVTLASAVAVLGAVCALAAWLPARRAARIDPAITLRRG